jgi:hypothetical protein
MKCVISRDYDKNETRGIWLILEAAKVIYRCVSLELPDNGNQHNTSCIPEGKYQVEKYVSEKHGKCFRVLDVPDRSDILILIGNFAAGVKKDTKGCILAGAFFADINQDGFTDIAESTKTMNELQNILPDIFELHII